MVQNNNLFVLLVPDNKISFVQWLFTFFSWNWSGLLSLNAQWLFALEFLGFIWVSEETDQIIKNKNELSNIKDFKKFAVQ